MILPIEAVSNEITGSQTIGILTPYDNVLSRDTTELGTYDDLRELRKDPTIALGRGLLVSGIQAGAWSVESDENVREDIIDFIAKTVVPLRENLIHTAVSYGRIDFGWQGYEKIFDIKDGHLVIQRLKPLLHDITSILIDTYGNFMGFRQESRNQILGVDVPYEKCLLINFDKEGGNLYGYPLLENIYDIYEMWEEANKGAKQYDSKVAGSHFVVHYPIGTTIVNDEAKDNFEIAMEMLTALESSGSMVMPSTTAELLEEITSDTVSKLYQWDVTLLSDTSARQPTFIARLRYLDTLKIRGLILPERSMTEGQYGTKSESESHIGLAITNMECIDRAITRMINTQVVDQLLYLNYGLPPNTVRIVSAPLVDLQVEFLRALYLVLDGKRVDITALQEKLEVPLGKETEDVKPNIES